jgi:hypothetical protein
MIYLESKKFLIRKGIVQLLEIKDAEIRLLNLHQCRHAIDLEYGFCYRCSG